MIEPPPETIASTAPRSKALCLFSGGLDSQLAVCVLREQGIHVEGVAFASPFFSAAAAIKTAKPLGLKLHVVDFTREITTLLKDPPRGFGSCLNPCIDCHAAMIRKAAEIMAREGFDFIATGEVLGQRPMSQRRDALNMVRKDSGIGDRLLRPLSAQLLPETEVEALGLVDRSRLLGLSGRNRKPQLDMARRYGIAEFPSPAGGCLLTEPRYARRLKNLMDHEGLDDERLLQLLRRGRHFRLEGGTLAIVGRNKGDNEFIRNAMRGGDALVKPVGKPGATVLAIQPAEADLPAIRGLCAAYSDGKPGETVSISVMRAASKPVAEPVVVPERQNFEAWMI
ncbi:MAG: tRNA 4-thiouridine(8) synthase ThiI [Kiritimatiellia bacterium]|jgi:tRNA-specific 2-thiouridylase